MSLNIGTRLGPYEIVALIGAGGMGEVYRARDTRLGRDVAVKVLPAALACDPQGLARFEREARAVAALSHPNIVALFDISRQRIDGVSDEVIFVVTELLEGKTVRERLEDGPIPTRKALDIARQIADALAAAHDRGIVHRDLKPENIFITTDGRVKVLDFGLAQVAATAGLEATETMAAAPKTIGTTPGTILGTVGYMAPEQVRGQPMDARADLFALGAVLYELLTRERAFRGESPADTISAILHADPVQAPRLATASPAVERIVRRCLEKLPAERFQSARDLSFALDTVASGGSGSTDAAAVTPAPARRTSAVRIVAAGAAVSLGVAAVAVLSFALGRRAQLPARPTPPALFSIPANIAPFDAATVSPDGRWVAYTGAPVFQNPLGAGISLRRLDSLQVQPLLETIAAIPPIFWSPDSRSIGYFVNSIVVVRELPDGPPRRVVDIQGRSTGAAWGPNGMLVIGTTAGLFKVPSTGGALQPLLKTDPAHEIWRGLPSFLPGGDRVLYTLLRSGEGEASLETHAATLDGRELGLVLRGVVGAAYADGHLLYGSNGALYARAFDPARLTLTGEARQITPSVSQNWRTGDVAARASETGVLVFRGAPETDVQFTWMDRTGRRLGTVGATDAFTNFDVSPDGQRIITARRDPKTGGNSLWLIDAERGVTSLVTPKDDDGFDDPTWTPDGRSVAYRHNDRLVLRAANGGEERTLLPKEAYPDAFTRDGRFLVYGLPRDSLYEAWVLDVLTPGAKPFPVVAGVTLADEGRFSPSGKWLAYHSNESGSDQVAIIPFPPTGEKWQISKAGGVQPRWSPDGQELFYLDPQGRLMAVRVPDSDPRRAAEPQALFSTGLAPSNALDQFAVVGSRFLFRLPASTSAATSSPVEVLTNWTRAGS
jgi:hypothetical protein